MARARKSHDTGKEEVKSSRAKLEPAYSGKVGEQARGIRGSAARG
jgi:hypothetical protein